MTIAVPAARRPIYLRPAALTDRATHYCPGCGHGIVQRLVAELLGELGVGPSGRSAWRRSGAASSSTTTSRRLRRGAPRPRAGGRDRRPAGSARCLRLHLPG